MTGRAGLLCGLLLLASVLSGCWDNRPIDARAPVLMLGVGPAPHGRVSVFLETPSPSGLMSLTNAAGGGGSGPSFYVLTGTGGTVLTALSNAETTSDRDIYLGQTGMVILSTKLTPMELNMTLLTLARLGPFSKTAYMGVTNVPLPQFMSFTPEESKLPALYFLTAFACSHCLPVNLARTVWQAEEARITPGASLWFPLITPQKTGYVIRQAALYRSDRLVRVLSPAATLLFGLATQHTSKAALDLPPIQGVPVSVRAISATTRYTVQWTHGRLHITLAIQAQGVLDVLGEGLATSSVLTRLESEVSARIAGGTLALLRQLQALGVDPVGFGRAFLYRHPELRPQWPSLYRHAVIHVQVTTAIHNIGDVT